MFSRLSIQTFHRNVQIWRLIFETISFSDTCILNYVTTLKIKIQFLWRSFWLSFFAPYISYFFVFVIKYWDKSYLRQNLPPPFCVPFSPESLSARQVFPKPLYPQPWRKVLTHRLKVHIPMTRKTWWQGYGTDSHVTFIVRKQRDECWCSACVLFTHAAMATT